MLLFMLFLETEKYLLLGTGTHFKKCTLGTKTPQLGPIEVVERKEREGAWRGS